MLALPKKVPVFVLPTRLDSRPVPPESKCQAHSSPGRLSERAARASLWSLASQGSQQVVAILAFLFLSRWLSPADYGLAGMAMSVTGVLAIAGDTGVVAALVRQAEIDEVAEATGFWVGLVGAVVLATIAVLAAPLLAWYFADARIEPLAVAMGLNFLLAAPGRVSTAKLVKRLDFSVLARISLTASFSGLAAGIVVARSGGGAWALFAQMAATFATQAALVILRAPYRASPRMFSRAKATEIVSFGSGMTGFLLAVTAARSGDAVLGGRFLGPSPLGLLSMGTKVVVIPVQRLSGALAGVFMPAYLELEDAGRGRAFSRALNLTVLVSFPVSLGIFAVAPEITALLPARWFGVAPTLRMLALGTLLEPLGWYSYAVLSAQGRSNALLRLGLLLIPVGWGGSLLGSIAGSAVWLALASAVWSGVSALGMAALIWKPLGLGQSGMRRLAIPLAAALLMIVAVRFVLAATATAGRPAGLAIGVLTGLAAYGIALFTVLRSDFDQLADLLKRALKGRRIAYTRD